MGILRKSADAKSDGGAKVRVSTKVLKARAAAQQAQSTAAALATNRAKRGKAD